MTQRDKAIYLDITPVTLRNWRKNKPNLYKIIMLGFAFDEVIDESKETYEKLEKLKEEIDKRIDCHMSLRDTQVLSQLHVHFFKLRICKHC